MLAILLAPPIAGCAGRRIVADVAYFPPAPASPHVVHLKSFNSLDDLVPRKLSLLDLIKGAPPGPFVQTPAGIDYRDGRLYICDTGMGAVHVWNLIDGGATRIGTGDEGRLGKPVDVAVDDTGRIFVGDTSGGAIVCFDGSGTLIRTCGPDDEPYRPVALAVRDDALVAAVLPGHRLDVYETATGARRGTLPSADDAADGGDAAGDDVEDAAAPASALDYPMGVATDSAGGLVVTEMLAGRVRRFDASGAQTGVFGRAGDRYGDLGKPKHVAVGPDGTMFIADAEFAHVHLFDESGRLLMLLGGPDVPIGATPMPLGVAIAPTLPDPIAALVPDDFRADYFVFVTNTLGDRRINLFAVGGPR